MGILINYPKFGRRAERKAREKRVAEAEERNKKSEESWKSSAELSQIRELKEREKLQRLANWDFIDAKQEVSFSPNIEKADKIISAKLEKKRKVKNLSAS